MLLSEVLPGQLCWHWCTIRSTSAPLTLEAGVASLSTDKSGIISQLSALLNHYNIEQWLKLHRVNVAGYQTLGLWNCKLGFFQLDAEIDIVVVWTKMLHFKFVTCASSARQVKEEGIWEAWKELHWNLSWPMSHITLVKVSNGLFRVFAPTFTTFFSLTSCNFLSQKSQNHLI